MAAKPQKTQKVTAKQAQLAIALMKKNKAAKSAKALAPKKAAPIMDAEDKIDHGVDESKEEN